MPTEDNGGYCDYCRRRVLMRRNTPNHLLHAILSIFLCGLWFPVWFLIALTGNGPWVCTRCGTQAK